MQNWLFDIRSRSFVLLVGLFLILTTFVYYEVTESFDQGSILLFSQIEGYPALDIFMQLITESSDVVIVLLFAVLMLLVPRTRRVGITLMMLILFSTLFTVYVKCGVDRDRPDYEYVGTPFIVEVDGIQSTLEMGRDIYAMCGPGSSEASYPSGHAARAAAFGVILGYALSERFPRGAYLLLLYPILTSLSRIYVLEHYPMDVISGTVIGIMLAGVLANKTKLYRIFESKA